MPINTVTNCLTNLYFIKIAEECGCAKMCERSELRSKKLHEPEFALKNRDKGGLKPILRVARSFSKKIASLTI